MKAATLALGMGLMMSPFIDVLAAHPGLGAGDPSAMPADTRCVVSAGSPVVDYGTQSRWQMQSVEGHAKVTPGKRMLSLSVACPYTRSMQFRVKGDRTVDGELRYGDRGSLTLRLSDAHLDGQPIQLATVSPRGGLTTSASSSVTLRPGDSVAAVQNGLPARGKNLSARITILPVMPEHDARVTAIQSSEARVTLELKN